METVNSEWSARPRSGPGFGHTQVRRIVGCMRQRISRLVRRGGVRAATRIVVSCLSLTLIAAQAPQDGSGDHRVFLPVVTINPIRTYYVSPTGDDENPGTEEEPWRTVNKAATTAIAGDTVIYEDGIYDLGRGQSVWQSGTSGQAITHQARHRRQAIFQLTAWGYTVTLSDDHHITFDGIHFRGSLDHDISRSRNVKLVSCHDLTFADCEFSNTHGHGLYLERSDDIDILGCDLHTESDGSADFDCLYLDGLKGYNEDILIENCNIYHSGHTGLGVRAGKNVVVQNNHIHDTEGHCVSVGTIHNPNGTFENIVVRNNVIEGAGTWAGQTWPKDGIRLHGYAKDVQVYRNEIFNCRGPGAVIRDDATGPIEIYNNTFYANDFGTTKYGHIFGKHNTDGLEQSPIYYVKDNIFHHTSSGRAINIESEWSGTFKADHNLWYASSQGSQDIKIRRARYARFIAYKTAGHEPHMIANRDPLFVDADAGDFTLRPGSPARGAASDGGTIGAWQPDDSTLPDRP